MSTDIEQRVRELQNQLCIAGHLNKALDDIMKSGGIGGPDAIFNILGDLGETAIRLSLGAPFRDREAELRSAMDKVFSKKETLKRPAPQLTDTFQDPSTFGDDHEKWKQFYAERPRMDIYSKPGDKVYFDCGGGYKSEQENARELLTMGGEYTVDHVSVGGSYSSVYLVEVPNRAFNTVMFAQPWAQTEGTVAE